MCNKSLVSIAAKYPYSLKEVHYVYAQYGDIFITEQILSIAVGLCLPPYSAIDVFDSYQRELDYFNIRAIAELQVLFLTQQQTFNKYIIGGQK